MKKDLSIKFIKLHFYIILFFLHFYVDKSEIIYKSVFVEKFDIIFVFSENKIYSYESTSLSMITNYVFTESEQYIGNEEEAEMISFAATPMQETNNYCQIYIIVKNFLYNFSKNGDYVKNVKIENMENAPSNIIIHECKFETYSVCTFFIALIDLDKNLKIYQIKDKVSDDFVFENQITYNLINSSGESSLSISNYVSCQIMMISSESKVLTCFYENQNLEIGTITFNPKNLNELKSKPPQFKVNSGATIIKSILYSRDSKAFVCYINNNKDCACLYFDIIENKWSDNEYRYLEQCNQPTRFYNLDFYEKSHEYILSCFHSINEFDSITFNSDMEIVSHDIFNNNDNNNINNDNNNINNVNNNINHDNNNINNDNNNINNDYNNFYNDHNNINNNININEYCISNTVIKECNNSSLSSIINNFEELDYKIVVICPENLDHPKKINNNFRSCSKYAKLISINSDTYSSINIINETFIMPIFTTSLINSSIIIPNDTIFTSVTNVSKTYSSNSVISSSLIKIPIIPITTITETYSSINIMISLINQSITIPSEMITDIKSITIPSEMITEIKSITIPSEMITIPSEMITDINPPISHNSRKIIKKSTNKTKEELINNLDSLIEDIIIGNIYEIKNDDYEVKIRPINYKEFESGSTYVNFLECENTLRKKNGLSDDTILTVIQMEIYKNDEKSLTNQVEYAVYDNNKQKLDLSVCANDKIEINYAISNTSSINFNEISYYSDIGVDVFNIKDKFFNDICYPYSNDSSDMILKDRISNIYQNFSICDNNCEYNKINISSMTITCYCNIKSNIDTKKEDLKFDKIYLDLFAESTFGVIICYNLVFNLENKINNMGFIIFTLLIILHIPIIISYCINGVFPINKYIINEMKKYHYLQKENSPIKKKSSIYKVEQDEITDKTKSKLKCKTRRKTNNNYTHKKGEEMSLSKKKFIHSLSNDNINKRFKKDNIKTKKNKKKSKINSILILNVQENNKNIIKLSDDRALYSDESNFKEKILKKYKKLKNNKIENTNHYSLIQIDATNTINNAYKESKYFLDNFDYEDAIIYDKRSFCRIYFICLMAKENILSTFFLKSPLELKTIRLCIFIFIYSCDFALNTLFYFNEKISDKYNYKGDNIIWFNILNNLTITFTSSILSFFIVVILQLLTNSKDSIEEVFREEERKMKRDKNYKVNRKTKSIMLQNLFIINRNLKCKIGLFLIIELLIMLFFYYFVTAFCEVYKETQASWIIDCFISFLISFPVEFLLALMISVFYIISIKYKIKILYRIAMIFYSLG